MHDGYIVFLFIDLEKGRVPSFSPTSSPELDALLLKFRKNVFLPPQLSSYEKKLVYHREYAKALKAEPVRVDIGGEEFILEHINSLTDVPARIKGYRQFLSLMNEKKDWDNLAQFLEGLHDSKRILPCSLYCQTIRRAGLVGRLDAIIESVARVRTTGFKLNNEEVVTQLMYWILYKAQVSRFDEKETKQALAWAEKVAYLLEDIEHARSSGGNDVRALPELIGILLQLAAINAVKYTGGKDLDGKVATYATRLLGGPYDLSTGLLNTTYEAVRVYNMSDATDSEAVNFDKKPRRLWRIERSTTQAKNCYLTVAAPVLHGMKIAQKVLGPEAKISLELQDNISRLEKRVNRYVFELKKTSLGTLGVKTYTNLFGSA